jgi:tight adherence protein B
VNGPLLLLLALATACAALASWLWVMADGRQRRQATLRRLGGRLAPAPREPVVMAPRASAPAAGRLATLAGRLDLPASPLSMVLVLAPAPLLALAIAVAAGWLLGAFALLLFTLVTMGALGIRREMVRRRLVRALPGFVDAMVRTITIGQSPTAAFLAAMEASDPVLRRPLGHAQRMLSAGLELDAALTQAGRMSGCEPLTLIGSVIRMSTQYGGRVDQVLERVATFLRDRQEAEEELHAVSAETRLSAWVLGSLPVAVTVLILFVNATYLAGMWTDVGGRKLLLASFLMELLGAFLLYRLARLR